MIKQATLQHAGTYAWHEGKFTIKPVYGLYMDDIELVNTAKREGTSCADGDEDLT